MGTDRLSAGLRAGVGLRGDLGRALSIALWGGSEAPAAPRHRRTRARHGGRLGARGASAPPRKNGTLRRGAHRPLFKVKRRRRRHYMGSSSSSSSSFSWGRMRLRTRAMITCSRPEAVTRRSLPSWRQRRDEDRDAVRRLEDEDDGRAQRVHPLVVLLAAVAVLVGARLGLDHLRHGGGKVNPHRTHTRGGGGKGQAASVTAGVYVPPIRVHSASLTVMALLPTAHEDGETSVSTLGNSSQTRWRGHRPTTATSRQSGSRPPHGGGKRRLAVDVVEVLAVEGGDAVGCDNLRHNCACARM